MNFLSNRLFVQRVSRGRYTTTKQFGSTTETWPIAATGLPCLIQEYSEAEQVQFGAQGASGLPTITFPDDPGCNPGDQLIGEGADAGRVFTVKDKRRVPQLDVTWWACDCEERT